jgi:hypothetical protein
MNSDLITSQPGSNPWLRKMTKYIASGQRASALRLLDRVIEYDMPLFKDDPNIQEDRHFAWLYKIDLLREWGRLTEALAWICLECEMNPKNVAALALKENLKRSLNRGPERKESTKKNLIKKTWRIFGME